MINNKNQADDFLTLIIPNDNIGDKSMYIYENSKFLNHIDTLNKFVEDTKLNLEFSDLFEGAVELTKNGQIVILNILNNIDQINDLAIFIPDENRLGKTQKMCFSLLSEEFQNFETINYLIYNDENDDFITDTISKQEFLDKPKILVK